MNLRDVLRQCSDTDDVNSILCAIPWGPNSPAAIVPPEIGDEIIRVAPELHFCEVFAIRHFFGDEAFDDLGDEAVLRMIEFAKHDA